MLKELIIKCDCRVEDCNQYLIISPIGSISIVEGQNYLAGIHLSSDNIDKIIEQLNSIKNIYVDNEKWMKENLLNKL